MAAFGQFESNINDMTDERIIVLGSHKGLGFSCVSALLENRSVSQVLGLSRKDSGEFLEHKKYQFRSYDFTAAYDSNVIFDEILTLVEEFKPTQIIYCAGGGPYGEFQQKQWKDHEWALKLNFLFPAKLLWSLMTSKSFTKNSTFLYVGSAIAESDFGDAMGPSYAAAKWAMKGLFLSVLAAEQSSGVKSKINLKWISPGYMDTDLLPKGSSPRLKGQVEDPKVVAKEILSQLGFNR